MGVTDERGAVAAGVVGGEYTIRVGNSSVTDLLTAKVVVPTK